jgi:hypothetical protein
VEFMRKMARAQAELDEEAEVDETEMSDAKAEKARKAEVNET